MGRTYRMMGKYQKSLENYEQSLIIRERHLGKGPSYAKTLNDIGNTYLSIGQYEEALKHYQGCLLII